MPLVTIVTPVYNGADHLAECIESLLRQTYANWHYVVVDNSSSDDTPKIAKAFARTDARIRYVRHDEFVEVIESYNRAFREVDGESTYCKALGADDWLYPQCLARMVELAERSPSVGVVGGYRIRGNKIDLIGLPASKSVATGRDVLAQSLLRPAGPTGSPTSLLFRTALVRKREPFFDPSYRHADTDAAYWALTCSDFGFVHRVLTFTRLRAGGEATLTARLNSSGAERIRMLLRYGPEALSPDRYRKQLRRELRWYVQYHVKQALRPSRRHDRVFHVYHRKTVDLISAAAPEDRDVKRAMAVVRPLLRS